MPGLEYCVHAADSTEASVFISQWWTVEDDVNAPGSPNGSLL